MRAERGGEGLDDVKMNGRMKRCDVDGAGRELAFDTRAEAGEVQADAGDGTTRQVQS